MESTENSGQLLKQGPIDAAIRIGFIALIAIWCFNIFRPFTTIVAWSAIIATASYPMVLSLAKFLGGRRRLAITVFVVVTFGLIILPGYFLTGSIISTGKQVVSDLEESAVSIQPPDISVRDWPVIGERLYDIWTDAYHNIEKVVAEYGEHVRKAIGWFFHGLARIGIDVLLTLISLLVAGLLMSHADSINTASIGFFERIIGRNGLEFSNSARDTIRSVIKGVVLVAVIQAFLAWIGFVLMDVPAAGVWAAIVLILSIMQLPALLVILPIVLYVFSVSPGTGAVIFAVWCLLIGTGDNFLKPMFLGKGLRIPMLVILIGALGGMILHGLIGLFIGSVVMAIGYQIYAAWVNNWEFENAE